jgi:long-chain acyl-CoA synthetase
MSAHRKNGIPARPGRAPAERGAAEGRPAELDVARTLAGRALLVTGATGFVGKVALSMLLDRYPEVGKVFVLVRPGAGGTAEQRFFGKVAHGRPFDPLRARHGDGFEAFLREKCVPVAGDVSDPRLGLSGADVERLRAAGLAAVVNSAGLVDFNPPLELALSVNTLGVRHAVELCRELGAGLLHVSTCYVAGNRDGVVHEDEELPGYFPRRPGVMGRPKQPELDPADFSVDGELADAGRRADEIRKAAEDRVQQSLFRDRAVARLEAEGRPLSDEKALKLALGREKRLWTSRQLVDLGMDRARHWGWPNTYTYSKSLGEQVMASAEGLTWSIVRPSIVESSLRYPFPGWNEGFTTSAPLAFIALRGHRVYPTADKAILDVVPVDLVAAGVLAATAELVERVVERKGPRGRVYHLASGDVNPLWARRAVELTALYRRRFYREREEGNATWNKLLSRLEPYPASRALYEATSSPALSAIARAVRDALRERAPRWGAPRISAWAARAADALDEVEDKLSKTKALWDLYMPFVWDNRYVFRCAAMRALRERLAFADRQRLPWDPEALDWRRYWLDVHLKGMEEWVFPGLEEEAEKKVHAPKAHRDLLELLDAACENHRTRVALRMTGERKDRWTYGELRRASDRVAAFLAGAGVAKGDRVLLASENRPEWAVAYFGILRAGAAAVPVDPQLTEAELANLWRGAGAKVALLSEEAAERAPGLAALAAAAVPGARAALLHEALAAGGAVPHPRVGPDDLASLIFTSGTTGTPKGVMLTHRNFTSLVAKLSTVFDLGPGDGLLSVLPLHHTFEFTCGLLVPLARGAEVEYLDELTSDAIGEALESGRVTAMIGVPALWSLLHRKITQELAAKPGFVEAAFDALKKGNAALRDSRLGVNLGKLLLWPVHRRFGGRLRLLVSGGSALDPEVQQAFREMGFDLYEGYGLTEAAPVLAVSNPEEPAPPGSVGPALPGVELRIADPDASGVGEVLARGPNVMAGYWRGGASPGVDPERTAEVLAGGWLRTGDLGRIDAEGNLTLVGRAKDVIIDANGKNVYPDEIEELYRDPELVKELCVVGLPDGAGEKIAMLLVPEAGPREELRARLEAHVRKVSASLPFHKRVKVWHVLDGDLPKTATRKVKRPLVRDELLRREAAALAGRRAREAAPAGGDAWVLDLVAEVARRPRAEVTHASLLAADLGFDSLLVTELQAALEAAGVHGSAVEHLKDVTTVGELARAVGSAPHRQTAHLREPEPRAADGDGAEPVEVPRPLAALGRALLGAGQRALYRGVYETRIVGEAFLPRGRSVLVVANHASHLDMGLVKVAMGEAGEKLAALAAKDYFFDTRLKRSYFENFTNLIPMERDGSLKKSLRAASEALARGWSLLIFPEGTRSRDGEMKPFFPTAGYLSLHGQVDVLPVHLGGTWEAFPPGASLPKRAPLEVRFGPPLRAEDLAARTAGLSRSEAYRVATGAMEDAVRALRAEWLREKARAERSDEPETKGAMSRNAIPTPQPGAAVAPAAHPPPSPPAPPGVPASRGEGSAGSTTGGAPPPGKVIAKPEEP